MAIAALCLLIACDSGSKKSQSKSPTQAKVFASNYPLAYFTQRITGDANQVFFPTIKGDPAFWKPSPDDIVAIQQCNPLVLNGASYEKWQKTVTLPENRIVDTSAGFADQLIEIKSAVTHQHGPEGDHSHGGTAFTTWIDFSLAIKQAQSTTDSLVKANIGPPDLLNKNLASLVDDLGALDRDLRELTSTKPKLKLVASHPIYQYLARAYDLDIQAMLWEPDVYPDEEQWQLLENTLAKHPAKWMLWEGEPLEQSVQRLQKLGIASIVFDPCANSPESGDFLTVMKQNIENLRPLFSP
jgi:zinc transport system substrate-binding protein